jgi:glyoxylase-like metal-dependent hydrolase (beta-lactamase superfamily II)
MAAAWRPVPGLPSGRLLPFLRRPDICCSNVFLVSDPAAVVVIDTGADAAQGALLARFASAELAERPRPAIVVLTHCHVDHVLVGGTAWPRFAALGAELAAHASGADVLAAGDTRITAAEFFSLRLPPFSVHLRLFSDDPAERPSRVRRVPCSFGRFAGEALVVDGTTVAECYPAPGHTPDSIVVRVGDVLFVGDLLFSLEPGVAGLLGFDPGRLGETVRAVGRMVREGGIVEVCPGHGPILSAADAATALARIERELATRTHFRRLAPVEIAAVGVLAAELIEEAERIFSVIGGRLLALAYHLEELGEDRTAAEIEDLLAGVTIEVCLASFHRFVQEYECGEHIQFQVLLKAVQVTRRIESTLARAGLDAVADLALLGRFRRLADDFMASINGRNPTVARAAVDLNGLVAGIATASTARPVADEEVLDAADDEAAFTRLLVRRLAAPSLFPDGGIVLATTPNAGGVVTDPDRLEDGLRAILEDLAGAGHARVGLETGPGAIVIAGDEGREMPFGLRRADAYRRRFAAIGAVFEVDEEPFRCRIAFGSGEAERPLDCPHPSRT